MPGTLVVSLDFELFWGMQDCSSLSKYGENVLGGRKAIPQLLELFSGYGIHATWATVGFQFAENAEELRKYLPAEADRPTYANPILSAYRCLTDGIPENENDYYFAKPILKEIASHEGQEIASHTFSHYYCREAGQTTEQFEADMRAARAIACSLGYDVTSVVFPRNQASAAHIDVLRKLGFTAYRDEENDWIHKKLPFNLFRRLLQLADVYLPLTGNGISNPRNEKGIVNVPGSRMYKPFFKPLFFMEGLKLNRIRRQMRHAAKTGGTFHLWWHPHNVGVRSEYHMAQLDSLLAYYAKLRETYGMRSLNMREVAAEICNSEK